MKRRDRTPWFVIFGLIILHEKSATGLFIWPDYSPREKRHWPVYSA